MENQQHPPKVLKNDRAQELWGRGRVRAPPGMMTEYAPCSENLVSPSRTQTVLAIGFGKKSTLKHRQGVCLPD